MHASELEQRRHKIFQLVVEAYIATASPVGSELVARKLRSTLSPATIRNIMVELEDGGLLEQPHTSAGRVPTDRGYRFYVDTIMELRHFSDEEIRQLEATLQPAELDTDQLFERTSEVLAHLTQQAAFILAQSVRQSTVKQVELVPLSIRKVLCILVANEEMIASHVVEIEEPMTRDEAAALARFINTELAGLSFNDLLGSLERRMLAQTDSFYHIVKRSLNSLQHALSTEPNERLLLEGSSYVVSQPEFSKDPRKAHGILKGLDAQDQFLDRIRQDLAPHGVRVRIGREVQVPGLEECSYVTAPFAISEDIVGGIGVLGPKRMDYSRMSALVEAMARCMTDLVTRWDDG
jgi:heat-inducible transcriptional repressor